MNQATYVIGAGIIGLLCARELMQAGRQVVVVDRRKLGRESSWAGGGILSPLYPWKAPDPVQELFTWSRKQYPKLIRDLEEETGVVCEYSNSGVLNLDAISPEIIQIWADKASISFEHVDSRKLYALEPTLAPGLSQAYWFPEVAQVRNPRILEALVQDLKKSGCQMIEDLSVSGFTVENRQLKTLQTSRGELPATDCVVAAGAWTGELLSSTGLNLPIKPVQGQMLLYRCQPGQLSHIVVKDYHYLIPRSDGRVLVGSTLEDVGFTAVTTSEAREVMHTAAVELMPSLAQCPLETQWAGLRPGSPQGIPYIGIHTKIKGLYVCSGHHRNGLALAPASARLCADLMLGRDPICPPDDYRLM